MPKKITIPAAIPAPACDAESVELLAAEMTPKSISALMMIPITDGVKMI